MKNNMKDKGLELRMYFFTIYQLTGIQAGIQCGHAALEYSRVYKDSEIFINFADNWKTWIILNGGTTNYEIDEEGVSMGSLNQIGDSLSENDIDFSFFREPDLNYSLTALCFICDERVFNKKDYPDFRDYSKDTYIINPTDSDESLIISHPNEYKEWIRLVGGMKNVFLRDLLKDKKLV